MATIDRLELPDGRRLDFRVSGPDGGLSVALGALHRMLDELIEAGRDDLTG